MSDMHGIPAAWYPDPANARMLRYWDGTSWTGQLRDAATAMSASAVNAPVSDFTGYDRIGQSNASYAPFGRGSTAAPHRTRIISGSAQTIAIWLYALVPLLVLVHQYVSWDFSASDLSNLAIHVGAIIFTVVLAVLLAAVDRSQLRNHGFTYLPPAALALLPPIHVIGRALAIGPRAIAVMLVALTVQSAVVIIMLTSSAAPISVNQETGATLAPVAGMTPPFAAEQLSYLLTPEGMAQKIAFDSDEGGVHYETVTCEPLLTTDLGAQTTCLAHGGIADYELVVQVLPDGRNVPFVVVSVVTDLG